MSYVLIFFGKVNGGIIRIIKVEAIVREEKCEAVMEALEDLQVNGLTVSRVEGYGAQRGSDNWTKGMKLEEKMKQKVKIEVVVSSEDWADLTEKAIRKAAYTGDFGDGKIFTYEVRSAQKIRTGETGYDAIQRQE